MLYNLKHTLKRSAYWLLPERLVYEQGDKPNILLFSSRRGGSTYLAEMIGAERGMRIIDQPFDLFKPDTPEGKIKARYLPPLWMSQFIHLNEQEEELVRSYMQLLLSGGLRGLSQPEFSRMNRTVLKIVNALPLLDWLADQFPILTIYLIRHPISQGLSIVDNRWGITARAYLENEFFASHYLSASQIEKGRRILERGAYLEKAVLNWICENLVPLKYARRRDLLVTYEELVLHPAEMIPLIARRLHLSDTLEMQNRISIPSANVKFSSRDTLQAIASNDNIFLVNKSKQSITGDEEIKIQELLDAFGIDEYRAGEILPHERLLHFQAVQVPS